MNPDSLKSTVQQLDKSFQQQKQATQAQINQVDPTTQALISGLNATKDQTFRDITNTANQRGILFSGFTPEMEGRYVGQKYMPALSQIQSNAVNLKARLVSQLAGIGTSEAKSISDLYKQDLANRLSIARLNYYSNNGGGGNTNNNTNNTGGNTTGKAKSTDELNQMKTYLQEALSATRTSGGRNYSATPTKDHATQVLQQLGFDPADFQDILGKFPGAVQTTPDSYWSRLGLTWNHPSTWF